MITAETKTLLIIDRAELLELIQEVVSNAIEKQPIPDNKPKYFTAEEAYQYLKLPSLGSLYQLTFKKRIAFIRAGKRLTFLRDDLDKYLMTARQSANQ